MTIEDELRVLEKQQSRVTIFKKKTEAISRLKLNFFYKMKKFEDAEDISNARVYYGYLIRTMKLSETIYQRMKNEVEDYSHNYSYVGLDNSEITSQLSGFNSQALERFKQVYLSFHASVDMYQRALSSFFYDLTHNNMIINSLIMVVEKQKEYFNDIESSSSDFFTKLNDQSKLHLLLEEERSLYETFMQRIIQLERETSTFSKRISEKVGEFNDSVKSLVREIRSNPSKAIYFPIQKLEHFFHKHTSIIALTIIGLGLAANLSALAGLGSLAVLAKTTMGLLSHTMEGIEALPSLSAVAIKGKSLINETLRKVNFSYQRAINY